MLKRRAANRDNGMNMEHSSEEYRAHARVIGRARGGEEILHVLDIPLFGLSRHVQPLRKRRPVPVARLVVESKRDTE